MGFSPDDPAILAAFAKGLIVGETPAHQPAAGKPKRPSRKVALVEPAFERPGSVLSWTVPLHVETASNGGAFKKAMIGRADKHRRTVARELAKQLAAMALPATAAQQGHRVDVLMVRLAPKMFDDDGLSGSFKWVRDTVALFLGVGDGPADPVRWFTDQLVQPRYGVRIDIRTYLAAGG